MLQFFTCKSKSRDLLQVGGNETFKFLKFVNHRVEMKAHERQMKGTFTCILENTFLHEKFIFFIFVNKEYDISGVSGGFGAEAPKLYREI